MKYPHDRIDGYVLLEMSGTAYVPRFTSSENPNTPFQNYKRHWNAWRVLMKRYLGHEPFVKQP